MIELEIGTVVVNCVSVALICLSMYIVDKKIIYYSIWAHTCSLTLYSSFFLLKLNERSCICVLEISILPLSANLMSMSKIFFLSICHLKLSLTFTSLSLVLLLTTVLPVLFKYCYKYCYSDNQKLWAAMKGRGLTDLVCLYNYEFLLSLCKIVRSSVILLLPLWCWNYPGSVLFL